MADRAFNSYPGAPSIAGDETLLIAQGGVTLNTTPNQILQAGLVPTFGDTTVRNLIFTANQSVSNVLAAPTATPGIPVWRQLSTDDIGGMGVFFSSPPPIGDVTPNTGAFTALSGLVTATGSPTARTLADRAADWVNVKDYGATLNGSTPDGAAFGLARAAITKPTGIIHVPRGGQFIATAPTAGPSGPVYWRYDGTTSGTGSTPVLGLGTDTVENIVNGGLYIGRTNSVAGLDPLLRVDNNVTHSGGGPGEMPAVQFNTFVTGNTGNSTTSLAAVGHTTSTGSGNLAVILGYGYKDIGGTSQVFGANFLAQDNTGLASSVSGSVVGTEFDVVAAGGADDGGAGIFLLPTGGGVRVGLEVIGYNTPTAASVAEIGYVVRAGAYTPKLAGTGPWPSDKTYAKRIITTVGAFSIAAYDASLATAMGSANAFRMASDQTFAFDGLTNSRTLGYVTADTALEYKVGGTTRWSVSDAGVMTASALATGGTTARTLAAIFADQNNVKSFGAVGDGSADDFSALLAPASPRMLPAGTFSVGARSMVALGDGGWFSPGGQARLKSVESGVATLQAPNFAQITSPPADYGASEDYIFNQFNYDTSHNILAFQTLVTGATTLGSPTTGYRRTPGTFGIYGALRVAPSAGYNYALDAPDGRTNVGVERVVITHSGNGDAIAYEASVFVNGTRSSMPDGLSATDFLANPAGGILAGQVVAGRDGVYLDPVEYTLDDGGHDVAGNGLVINLRRSNGVGALGAVWQGVKFQSAGPVAIDAAINAIGPIGIGLDLSSATLQDRSGAATHAAIAMAAGARIYGHATNADDSHRSSATVLGTEWLSYETATGWNLVVGSNPVMQASAAGVVRKTASADQSADVYVATAAGSHTIPDGCSWECLTPAATIATFTTTMPANPIDKQEVWISTTQTITTWTLNPNTGQTINGAPTTLGANTSVQFRYNLATTTWFRML